MASLEWKSRLSTGSPRAREVAGERHHVVERRVGRPQPAQPQQAEDAKQPLGRVRPRRARVGVLQALGQPPVQTGADGHFEQVAGAGTCGVVVGQEVRRQRRLDELGPALVRLVEERRHAGFDEVALALERRHMIGREAEAARSVRHRARRRPRPRSRPSARRAAPRTVAAAASTHTRAAARRRPCTAASPRRGDARRFRSHRRRRAAAARPRTAGRSPPGA